MTTNRQYLASIASRQCADEERSAANPDVEQDHKHNWCLDSGNLHVNGLRWHIEIGREENYVTQHDLHVVE
jgi:hypothetical protein